MRGRKNELCGAEDAHGPVFMRCPNGIAPSVASDESPLMYINFKDDLPRTVMSTRIVILVSALAIAAVISALAYRAYSRQAELQASALAVRQTAADPAAAIGGRPICTGPAAWLKSIELVAVLRHPRPGITKVPLGAGDRVEAVGYVPADPPPSDFFVSVSFQTTLAVGELKRTLRRSIMPVTLVLLAAGLLLVLLPQPLRD